VSITWLYQRYEIVYIIPDKSTALALRDDPDRLWRVVREWASTNYHPAEDRLALTGNLTMVVVAALALREESGAQVAMLRYDHDTGKYYEIGETHGNYSRAGS
jgi:hypothetical protein